MDTTNIHQRKDGLTASGFFKESEMRKIKCTHCNHTLFKEDMRPGSRVEIRCSKCRKFVPVVKA